MGGEGQGKQEPPCVQAPSAIQEDHHGHPYLYTPRPAPMHGPGCVKAWGEQDHLRLPPGLHSLPNLVLQITLGFYWGQSQPWPIRAPAIEPTLLWKTQNGKQSASLERCVGRQPWLSGDHGPRDCGAEPVQSRLSPKAV